MKEKIKRIFNNYENWKSVMIFNIIADSSATTMGIYWFGIGNEGNPLMRYAIESNFFIFPILMGIATLVLFYIPKLDWTKKKSWRYGLWALAFFYPIFTWFSWILDLASLTMI